MKVLLPGTLLFLSHFVPVLAVSQNHKANFLPQMLSLPGADFYMGDSTGNPDEQKVHKVRIKAFQMSKFEIKVSEFQYFIHDTKTLTDAETQDGSYAWDTIGWNKNPDANWRCDERGKLLPDSCWQRPVAHVTWVDAARYCNWLSKQFALDTVYVFLRDTVLFNPKARGYRLPTEAEWEYAAKGKDSRYPFAGSKNIREVAWFSQNSGRKLHPVGLKKPNVAGLHDLSGNVWEWCHDWYSATYYSEKQVWADPHGPDKGTQRVLRGGAANNNPAHCRASNRSSRYPDYRDAYTGFRVMRPN